MTDVICNLCGSTEFEHKKTRRGGVRRESDELKCSNCGSKERTRALFLYLERYADLKPGMKVLHIAPERAVFNHIARIVGDGYDPCDIDTERYQSYRFGDVSVRKFDL